MLAPGLGAWRRPAGAEVLAALTAASSFSTWEALRAHQGLSASRAARVMARTLRAVLARR